MDPIDDFLKTAGLWDALKHGLSGGEARQTAGEAIMRATGQGIGGAAAASLIAAGGYGVSKGFGAIRERITKPRDYKAMLGANPVLSKYDAGQVQMVYNSLRSQSPSMAKDPLIAGSFVHKTLNLAPEEGPFVDPQTVKMLAETQRNLSQARSDRGSIAEAFKPTGTFPVNPLPFRGKDERFD